MKKLLKTLACSAVAALVGASAFANYDWYDTSIGIGGIKSNFQDWSRGNGAPDTDLGALTSLTLSSVEMNIWDDDNDRGGVNMFFRLYGDNGQIGGDVDVWLGGAERIEGSVHDFSVSYTGPYDLADAFGVTLEDGKTYYLNMWAKSYGDAGDHWYSGDGDNYHTKFVYCGTPKTYTLVESADDLVVGADYLVVSTVEGAYSAMKNEVNGTGIGCLGLADDAISGNTIAAASDAIVWRLNPGQAEERYQLYSSAAGVFAADSDDLAGRAQLLADGDTDLARWTVDLSALPDVKFYSVSYPDRCLQRDNFPANERFAAYDRAHVAPRLYRDDSTALQTVTFDAQGGTSPVAFRKYVHGTTYWGIRKPTWTGEGSKKFMGWFDAPEGGTRVTNYMAVTEADARTIYAHWGDYQTVYFNANGGTYDKVSVVCGGSYSGLTKPTWTGEGEKKFLGWYDAPENGERVLNGQPVTGGEEKTLYAYWGDYQTVYFNANGGTYGKVSVVCAGTYTGLTKPTWTGEGTKKFLGWYDALENGERVLNGDPVTGGAEKTLYAYWGGSQTVYFNANGGTYGKVSVECLGTYTGLTRPTWDGHKFLGWFDAPENGERVLNYMPVTGGDEKTLYAYWTETGLSISGFSMSFRSAHATRSTTTVQDVLTADSLGLSGSYANFSGKTATSTAVYAGQAMKGSGTIQMRSKNSNSGIVTTGSGGKVAKVAIDWSSGKKVDIYGKNSAYSAATDLYDSSTQGTLIGSITNSSELAITDEYTFIGLRSNDGAVYLNSVTIDWLVEGEDPQPTTAPTVTLSASSEEVYAGEAVTITASAANFSVGEDDLVWEWSVNGIVDDTQDGTTFTLDTSVADTYEVKAEATDGDAITNATVSILVKPQTVTLTPSATEVEVGETVTITATAEGFSGAVTWTWAADEGTENGATYTLTPSAAGEYVVMAEATYSTQSAEASVTITVSEHVEVTGDVLTLATTGVTGSGYTGWTATGDSGTKYAGTTAANSGNIQMNSSTSSSKRGIVITESTGRDVKSVAVAWGSDPGTRTLAIYGSTTAYSGPSDLSGDNKGTLLGSLTANQTTLNVAAGYPYIGIYAPDGAVYVASVTIEFAAATPTVTLAASATEVEVGETVTITATATGFSGDVTWEWLADAGSGSGDTYTLTPSAPGEYEVIAEATCGDESADASVTITATAATVKYAITVDPGIEHGTVSTDPAGPVAEGTPVTVNGNPDAGYALGTVTVNGTGIEGTTFNMPAGDVTVSATFVPVPTYTLVESADDFVVGADYLIVAVSDGVFSSALKNEANGTRIGIEEVEIDGNTIANGSAALVWQINPGQAEGRYQLYNSAAGVFAAAPNSAGNNAQLLTDGDTDLARWTIDFTDLPTVKLSSVQYTDRCLQRNSSAGTKYFATYTGTQKSPRLYLADSTEVQTMTFDAQGGTSPVATRKYVKGRIYWGIRKPEWTGEGSKKFMGWFDAPEGGTRVTNYMAVTEADARTIYAHWGDYQTVYFDANGGSYTKTSVECGGTYSGLTKPEWTGEGTKKFLGWYDAPENGARVLNGDPVTGGAEKTLYAYWGDYQTVYFEANGGSYTKTSVVCAGTYTGLTKPTWTGEGTKKFLGWYDALENGERVLNGDPVTGGAEKTLYAYWGGSQTVYFDANGGSYTKTSVECLGTYTGLTRPTWDGHKFLGWYDALEGGERVLNYMPVTGGAEKTLYAYWTENGLAISGFRMKSVANGARNSRSGDEQVFEFSYAAVAGVLYEIEWTDSLDGEWTVVKSWVAEDDGFTSVTVSVPTRCTGFFRFSAPNGEE